jgi:[acyl-carrier-protein] S-malonyltransferase
MQFGMLFPGQGSQVVGMGADLCANEALARQTFEEADELLGLELGRLCFDGPLETLTETRNAQPALLVHSVAVLRVLEAEGLRPAVVAGHSLGEYTALVAAGALRFADAVRAVRRRGELMFESGLRHPGAMAAVVGLDHDRVQQLCDGVRTGVCEVANFNAPDQLVISGATAAIDTVMPQLRDAGARVVKRLNVSGAFHSTLMREPAEHLAHHLDAVEFSDARIPVIANVTGRAEQNGARLRDLVKRQIASPVRWSESMLSLREIWHGSTLEVGAGSVLRGLLRRIERGAECTAVGDCAAVQALRNRYREQTQPE